MKKICLLLNVLILFLTSCSIVGDNMNILNQDDSIIADNTFERLINKINTQDSSGLESLFSKAVQDTRSDLKENCADLIQFIQGDIVSVSDAEDAGVGVDCKVEKGKIVKIIQSAYTCETNLHKYYVAMKECTKDDFDYDNIGLLSIYIIRSEDWKEDWVYRGDGKWTPGINIDY